MAHKKGAGSTKNGRDSNPKRLGIKIYGNQLVKVGSILIRQRGLSFKPGKGVRVSKDFTMFATRSGLVTFKKCRKGNVVSVFLITKDFYIIFKWNVKKTFFILLDTLFILTNFIIKMVISKHRMDSYLKNLSCKMITT